MPSAAPTLDRAAILDIVAASPMFDALGPDQLGQLSAYFTSTHLAAGEVLFEEGDAGDYLCFVASGTLEMVKGDDGEVVVARMPAGRSFGEMALVDQLPRSATARAVEATDLLVLSRDSFEKLLSTSPVLGVELLKQLARMLSLNLRRTTAQLAG